DQGLDQGARGNNSFLQSMARVADAYGGVLPIPRRCVHAPLVGSLRFTCDIDHWCPDYRKCSLRPDQTSSSASMADNASACGEFLVALRVAALPRRSDVVACPARADAAGRGRCGRAAYCRLP